MAVREAEWTYSNDGRIAFVFLAFAIVLLALGLLAVTAFGSDAANAGAALLAIAIFLLVFALLVFLPRLARRGAASFSVYSRRGPARSEEHTSELQSLAYLVCRLLLEKKKKKNHSLRM